MRATTSSVRSASLLPRLGYRGLVASAPLARSRAGAAIWDRAWSRLERRGSGTMRISLHGHPTIVNIGHPYPAFMRRWPTYNSPLVRAVRLTHAARRRSLTLVDVGASVGDTALLVRERCPGMVEQIFCIEGDDDFAAMLAANVGDLPGVHPVQAMAGDGSSTAPSLVRTHAGSASPRGSGEVGTSTLDDLVMAATHVDLVKIDTDGYDGRVLLGRAVRSKTTTRSSSSNGIRRSPRQPARPSNFRSRCSPSTGTRRSSGSTSSAGTHTRFEVSTSTRSPHTPSGASTARHPHQTGTMT